MQRCCKKLKPMYYLPFEDGNDLLTKVVEIKAALKKAENKVAKILKKRGIQYAKLSPIGLSIEYHPDLKEILDSKSEDVTEVFNKLGIYEHPRTNT